MYFGFLNDPRNTDNAWLETAVFHFHGETAGAMTTLPLQSGGNVTRVAWVDLETLLASDIQPAR